MYKNCFKYQNKFKKLMKKFYLNLVLMTAAVMAVSCSRTEQRLVDYVDPMVGTDFTGHTFPGATAPFGMVQLSPDTRMDTWEGCSGYHYSDDTIIGFSHTHLSGTGVLDYGDVLLMPVTTGNCTSRISRTTMRKRRPVTMPSTWTVGMYWPS